MGLLKREIRIVKAGVLNSRFCWLVKRGEEMPANVITYADMKELVWIEDELHRRLLLYLGRDPYPPDRVKEPAPSNYMISLLKKKSVEHEVEPTPGPKLNFKTVITSSIGSKVAEYSVKVNSKSDADAEAQKTITKLGLKRATYKIS